MAFINEDQVWDWQFEDCYFADFNVSQSDSNGSSQSEKTPVKGIIEDDYLLDNIVNKDKRECHWSESWRQSKRRRVLPFDSEVIDVDVSCDEANSSVLVTSNEAGDSVNEVLSRMSNWLCEDADATELPCHEPLDQSVERWISSCFTDSDMELNLDEKDADRSFDVNEENGMLKLLHTTESTILPKCNIRIHHNSNSKGIKSIMRTSYSSSASIVYPFTFLKPCGFSGDVTLKDINRKVHTPPKSQEDYICYSAFSGKPVVAKTRLRIGGGKGSITIMRTKG